MELKTVDSLPKTEQVVAARINKKVSGAHEFVARAVQLLWSGAAEEYKIEIEFYSRAVMEMMAACDLGKKWEDLAKSPTYFGFDEDGLPIMVKDGIFKWKETGIPNE